MPTRLANAQLVVALARLQEQLSDLRHAGRLSVLGWILRQCREAGATDPQVGLVRRLAGSFGTIDELIRATGLVLEDSDDFMSSWLINDQLEGHVVVLDSEGPILMAFAVSLLSSAAVERIPPAPWLTDSRAERLKALVDELAEWTDIWGRLGETADEVVERAARLRELIVTAKLDQDEIERVELVGKPLDAAKVESNPSTQVVRRVTRKLPKSCTNLGPSWEEWDRDQETLKAVALTRRSWRWWLPRPPRCMHCPALPLKRATFEQLSTNSCRSRGGPCIG